jgi:hypothetical protein
VCFGGLLKLRRSNFRCGAGRSGGACEWDTRTRVKGLGDRVLGGGDEVIVGGGSGSWMTRWGNVQYEGSGYMYTTLQVFKLSVS